MKLFEFWYIFVGFVFVLFVFYWHNIFRNNKIITPFSFQNLKDYIAIVNSKNAKLYKNSNKTRKKQGKNDNYIKIYYYNIKKPLKINSLKMLHIKPKDKLLFPFIDFCNNYDFIKKTIVMLVNKLWNQNQLYRATSRGTIIEDVAKTFAVEMANNKKYDIQKKFFELNSVGDFYKKEKKMLSLLIIRELVFILNNYIVELLIHDRFIKQGTKFSLNNLKQYNKNNSNNFSPAFIYGIVKFNHNATQILLKLDVVPKNFIISFFSNLLFIDNKINTIIYWLKLLTT